MNSKIILVVKEIITKRNKFKKIGRYNFYILEANIIINYFFIGNHKLLLCIYISIFIYKQLKMRLDTGCWKAPFFFMETRREHL